MHGGKPRGGVPTNHWHKFAGRDTERMAAAAAAVGALNLDAIANLAIGVVLTAPTPATTGPTLVLQSGQGAQFPVTPFDVLMWPGPALGAAYPTIANAEIGRCTARATDTLTITRGLYGTTKQTVAVGWLVSQPIDANLLGQLSAATNLYLNSTQR